MKIYTYGLSAFMGVLSVGLGACGGSSPATSNAPPLNSLITTASVQQQNASFDFSQSTLYQDNPLSFINSIRSCTGFVSRLSKDARLSAAAKNQADDVVTNQVQTHYQGTDNTSLSYDHIGRAKAAGYGHIRITEDIAYNQMTITSLMDELLRAPFHRIAILDFEKDQVGLGHYPEIFPPVANNQAVWSSLAMLLGVKELDDWCTASGSPKSNTSGEEIYNNLCNALGGQNAQPLALSDLQAAQANIATQNPDVLGWPYEGAVVKPSFSFYKETPNPLPECTASGYPISVHFRPGYFDASLQVQAMQIREKGSSQDLPLVKILTTQSDLITKNPDYIEIAKLAEHYLTDPKATPHVEWAVAFPEQPLKWGTEYQASVTYAFGSNTPITKTWAFATQKLPANPYILDQDGLVIQADGDTVYIHMPPQNCQGYLTDITASDSRVLTSHEQMDGNTLKLRGKGTTSITFTSNTQQTRTL